MQIRQSFNKQHRLKYFGLIGILFILWLPYLLNYFPGTTTWDTEYQLTQVIGARPINAAHPILHTLFIKAIYSSSLLFFGNANIALAMVTVAQMLLLSLIYAYVIYYLYHNNYPKVIWLGSVLFYGVFALNATHTVVLWKDILFSAVFLLFSLFLWRAKDVNFNDRKDAARYFLKLALPAVLVCLMRNNGIYIFLGLIPFMLYFFRIRLMHILIMITLTLITQYGVERILHNRFDVIPSYANDKVELLSIPIQQISRVVVEDGHVDQESKALLEKLMSSEDIKSNYNPVLSDPMKQLIRSSENVEFFERSISDYGKLWLSLGLANPHLYMKAYIDQTRGYWYPDIQGPVIRIESAGKEDSIDTYQVNLLGDSFSNFMNRVNFIYLDIPILGIFYSLATYIWFVLFVLAVLFIRRMNFLATLPAIILWGILLVSTPVSGEFRYAYPIVISAPLYMAMLVDSFKVKAIYDRQKNSAD